MRRIRNLRITAPGAGLFALLFLAAAGASLWLGGQLVLAQDTPPRAAPRSEDQRPVFQYGRLAPSQAEGFFNALRGQRQSPEQEKLREAIEVLRTDESSDTQQEEAKEQIEELLGEQFDADLEHREKQIADLEAQIVKLKQQLAKRREAKQRLIELRLELLINEAEGLGFPSAWNSGPGPGGPPIIGAPIPNSPAQPSPPPGRVRAPRGDAFPPNLDN